MSFDQDRFMGYFKPLDSTEPVARVLKTDLREFNSNIERLGLEPIQGITATDYKISIDILIKMLRDAHELKARSGDQVGPFVHGLGKSAVQSPGFRIYRTLWEEAQGTEQ